MSDIRVWASAAMIVGSAACAMPEPPRPPAHEPALAEETSQPPAPACVVDRASLDGPLESSPSVSPTMSDDKRWLLTSTKDAAAIWSIGAGSVKLETRVAVGGYWSMHAGGRTYGRLDDPRSLFVVDPAPLKVTRIEDVSGFADGARSLILVGEKSVRRLDRASLEELEAVQSPERLEGAYSVRFLEKTRAVVVGGDTLVTLANASIRRFPESQLLATSDDERRMIVCSKTELGIVDTTTGQTIAEWPLEDATICQRSEPTITPDGRFVLAVEDIRPADRVEGIMEVVVFETETGKTRRVRDASDGFGTSFGAHASFERAESRLCVEYGTGHWHAKKCGWVLDDRGTVTIKPERLRRPASVRGSELAHATSPDGKRIALVTSSLESVDGVDMRKDFRFTLYDARSTTIVEQMKIAPGTFAEQHTTSDPILVFTSPERITFHPVAGWIDISTHEYLDSMVIDVGAKRVVPLHEVTHDFENGFMLGKGVYEIATDRTIPFDDSTWDTAPIIEDRCAPWIIGASQ